MLVGGLVEELWVLTVGRLLYGFGGEALAVLHNAMLISWFSGSALRRTFAISHVVARVVSAKLCRHGRRGLSEVDADAAALTTRPLGVAAQGSVLSLNLIPVAADVGGMVNVLWVGK